MGKISYHCAKDNFPLNSRKLQQKNIVEIMSPKKKKFKNHLDICSFSPSLSCEDVEQHVQIMLTLCK